MDAATFVRKWRDVSLSERSASQQHFLDLCDLVEHPKPAEVDKSGESFTFERGAAKHGGGQGWADVWKKGYFGWEYKGRHRDLTAAYDQLLKYREALENPPLLIVCDMGRLLVHTNFTNTPATTYELDLDQLDQEGRFLEILRAVFHAPAKLRPGATSEAITEAAAGRLAAIALSLRSRGLDPHRVAHFLDRVVFCLFAEDIGLLPAMLFTRLAEKTRHDPPRFTRLVHELFGAMAEGGDFGLDTIRWFDGNLFADAEALELTAEEIGHVYEAARLDWGAIDPSIFGTLFERGMDPAKRSQLGAHYTSRADIETLIEPVIFWPLRREWQATREEVERQLARRDAAKTRKTQKDAEAAARSALQNFLQRLAQLRILDPACGSGNFLYVALQKLKDLEKEVIVYAMDQGFPAFIPLVGPWQLHGIEVNPYAYELAQMTVWIGYLQWIRNNGFGVPQEPILRPMDTFELKDAILDLTDPDHPQEPEWPEVDFIVGNPPFLGGKLLRRELGDDYVDQLFRVWNGRVPREADLVTYWFEKARGHIEAGRAQRAGLLATQGIRGGANREVLKRIKDSGEIFFAVSDRPWILDGAVVHVSMVGFDEGAEDQRVLDGTDVETIHANLSPSTDISGATRIPENAGLSFMGDTKGGSFDIPFDLAVEWLRAPNPNGRPTSDVLLPWINGRDLTSRSRSYFIIDFGVEMAERAAAGYEAPFAWIEERVRPMRTQNKREAYRLFWWRHVEARSGMRHALRHLPRFIVTTTVSKHRVFGWMAAPTLPDHQLIVFSCPDDYFFGVLHSGLHELWARAQGTQLRERESGFRYTPTSCFETFPFPWPLGEEPMDDPTLQAITTAARELDDLRERWLNPPEWTREEILEFPGSIDGPWARYVVGPDDRGIGTVRWPRLVPHDDDCAAKLKVRTLTNLYNQRPAWLDHAHRKLDEAVFAAYGWDPTLPDDDLLAALLELNLERSACLTTQQAP